MKKVLILGGTRFIGRNLLEKLTSQFNFDITIFNRGITNSSLFANINHVKGDRRIIKDLMPVLNQDWDLVVDISCYWAGALEKQFQNQKGRIGKYIFISTSSHYKFNEKDPTPIKEGREIIGCSKEQKQSEDPYAFYNENKAECERILTKQNDLEYVILRPSLVIGKYDYTDRLYYWLYKIQHQNKILIGNRAKGIGSYTNVNDLVDLIIISMNNITKHRIYNVRSFDSSIKRIIEVAGTHLSRTPKLVSGDTDFLEKNKIYQWTSLPLWLDGDYLRFDSSRASKEFKFQFTDIYETIYQLVDYYKNDEQWRKPKTKPNPITESREEEIINKLETAHNNT